MSREDRERRSDPGRFHITPAEAVRRRKERERLNAAAEGTGDGGGGGGGTAAYVPPQRRGGGGGGGAAAYAPPQRRGGSGGRAQFRPKEFTQAAIARLEDRGWLGARGFALLDVAEAHGIIRFAPSPLQREAGVTEAHLHLWGPKITETDKFGRARYIGTVGCGIRLIFGAGTDRVQFEFTADHGSDYYAIGSRDRAGRRWCRIGGPPVPLREAMARVRECVAEHREDAERAGLHLGKLSGDDLARLMQDMVEMVTVVLGGRQGGGRKKTRRKRRKRTRGKRKTYRRRKTHRRTRRKKRKT